MSEETREVGDQGPQDGNDGKDDHGDRVCKHRMGRRTRLTVLVVTLLGAGILLGAGPNSIGDHSRDRTIVPSFGKNDLIIRQVKNHDFQKPENGSGYSR